MVDGKVRHNVRFGQPHVDGQATPPFLVSLQRAPIRHAAACRAEMETERLAADICLGRPGDMNTFALKVIDPQHAIAATCGAIARRGGLGRGVETPLNCTAEAGTVDHHFFMKVGGGNVAIFASSWAARSGVHFFWRNS